ncbi:MAG: DUF4468 domain-containing protein [Bacteroidales bacterium]|nr:DUF4468 domain-containing protein [Bacteroidales bacterium]
MKRKILITLCIVALTMGGGFAQKVIFPTDNRGRICFANEYETDQSKAELFESANLWAVSTFHAGDAVFSKDEEKGEIMANGTVKSKSSYNPFAGAFNEYVTFVIKFKVEEGKIAYTLYRPTITETYAGYGSNSKTSNLDDIYANYIEAYASIEAAKNDPSLSKKDQKNIIKVAESFIKDSEESLEEAYAAMRSVTKMLESNLFR